MSAAFVSRPRPLHAVLVALLVLVGAAAFSPSRADAAATNLSIMMDDDLLLYRGDQVSADSLRRMKSLGVDYVRVSVLWSVVAEDAKKTKARARKFKGQNPATYPRTNWDKYDRLVRAGQVLGVGIYFNVTGPGPSWAHEKAPKSERANQRTWKPKPKEFEKFVEAVGKRYNGSYVDENDGRTKLPKVTFWSIYNEPNQGGWLTPQYEKRNGKKIPASPHLYRELFYRGRRALNKTGHQFDIVLAGETAPLGSNGTTAKSPMRPKRFIREFMCAKANNAEYKGSDARRRGCGTWAKMKKENLTWTAWGHHPYTKDLGPTQRDKHKDSLTLANASELTALLDTLVAKTGNGKAPNYQVISEFGYETNPPDTFAKTTLAQQAEYLNVGDYIAYKDPRVFATSQFLLRDVDPVKRAKKNSKQYWFTYQSGLFGLDGKAKPAASAWAFPFHVTGVGTDSVGARALNFWGQLRFRPNGTDSKLYLQFRPTGAADFITLQEPVNVPRASAMGFWEATRAVPGPGTWRAAWLDGLVPTYSREIVVG